MKVKKGSWGLVSIILLSLSAVSFSQESNQDINNVGDKWHSVALFSSTHNKIAKQAIKRIDKSLYPDIDIFSSNLISAAACERGHANIHDNGGRVQEIWETGNRKNPDGVIPNYLKFRTEEAYFDIGVICHLTEDQGVPAHAANIDHFLSEGLESYADYDGKFGEIPFIASDKKPYDYYQMMQDETRAKLATWVNPETHIPFWVPAQDAPRMGMDATSGPHGSYGGGKDTYSFWRDKPGSGGGHVNNMREMIAMVPEITTDRLSASVGYTRAVLEAASKNLPPLVKDLKLSANIVNPGQGFDVQFTILENRLPDIKYSVILRKEGGDPDTIISGNIKLNPAKPVYHSDLNEEKQPEEFLAHGTYKFHWTGYYRGEPAGSGSYTMEVSITDADGNTVPAKVNSDSVRENDSIAGFSVAPQPHKGAEVMFFNGSFN